MQNKKCNILLSCKKKKKIYMPINLPTYNHISNPV